jgi:3-oxoacyl-[acyl-carrier protein] reductase
MATRRSGDRKSALVTGASRGIGRAIALRLARAGFAVIINYRANKEAAAEVVSQIQAAGGMAQAIQADIAVPGESVRLFDEAAQRFDGLDVLVNNAGAGITGTLLSTTEAAYDELFAITRSVFFILQRAGLMLNEGGRIINVSSIATRQPAVNPAYTASKLAVEQFTRALAHEIGARGITVNAVLPGAIDTDMLATALGGGDWRVKAAAITAFGRVGQPDEVASLVAFLASDDAGWITAETIAASGGRRFG